MEKKRISTIILNQGSAVKGLKDPSPFGDQDPESLAQERFLEGADVVLVLDQSKGDAEHEAALTQIRQLVRRVEGPVWGAGNVNRVEDIKKLLYAGCRAALLNWSKESNRAMLQEVSERFGKEKIAVCVLPDADNALTAEELSQIKTWAGRLIELDAAGNAQLVLEQEDLAGNQEPWPLDFEELKTGPDGLVPVVAQDWRSDEVLMVAYMNREAYEQTLRTGRMTYWSRSRKQLWVKGETSGHFQYLKELRVDCDSDTLLARIDQVGAACHTGNRSCFYRTLLKKEEIRSTSLRVLEDVYAVIKGRRENPKEGSYTNYLFEKGMDKILKKCGEEAAEIIIAAKNPNPEEVKYEIADFLYHMMVLMAERGISWEEIAQELVNRE